MEIAIIIALILLNGVFAMSEIALISARKSSLSNDIRHGSSTARIALKLANDPDKFLSTIQIQLYLYHSPYHLYLAESSFSEIIFFKADLFNSDSPNLSTIVSNVKSS